MERGWCSQTRLALRFQREPISTYDRKSRGEEQPALSVQQLLEGPLYVHPVPDPRHPEVYQVLLLEVWQVAAVDLIVHEGLFVLTQVQALQPVGHVWLSPQVHRLSRKRLI